MQSFDREDGKLSFHGPVRLFEDFCSDSTAMASISSRQT
jgi:hypothetical protein